MSVSVSDIRMPPGLADHVVGRDRRRKARIRLTGAVSAVAVAAAVAAAIAVPGWPGDRHAPGQPSAGGHVQTASYVLSRAAAAQVDSSRLISVDRGVGGVTYTYVATQQQRIVSSKLDSAGQPYFQIKTEVRGSAYKETTVEYQDRVYSTLTTSSEDHGPFTISAFLPLQSDKDPAAAFQQALKAGTIAVIGHRNLNGRDTILLRIKAGAAKAAAALPPDYIWLDSSTYLVAQTENFVPWPLPSASRHIRVHGKQSWSPVAGNVSVIRGKVTWSPVLHDITWLSPTPGNLALLTLTPPSGFTKIPSAEMEKKYLGPIS
jgi:hypothetical protein